MSIANDLRTELLELLVVYTSGAATDEQFARLEEILDADEAARAFYIRALDMHANLYWHHRQCEHEPEALADRDASMADDAVSGGAMVAEAFVPARTVHASRPARSTLGDRAGSAHARPLAFLGAAVHGTATYMSSGWPLAYLVSTVIFGIGLLIGSVLPASRPEQIATQAPLPGRSVDQPKAELVARITAISGCRWTAPPAAPVRYERVALGRQFQFDAGLMEITYDNGAKVVLQGPVAYRVESHSGGFLSVGKLTARLEKSEIRNPKSETISKSPNLQISKFVVRTPTATVTDLGTEFGVEVGKEGRTEVHVLQGVVEARLAGVRGDGLPAQRVGEGCAVEIGPKASQFRTIAFAPQSFVRTFQPPVESPSESAYIAAVLADKPLGYWPLNEPAHSRTFHDRSGNGIHGYAMRNVTAGRPGPLPGASRGVELSGNGYIDFGRRDQFAMKNDFTIEAWVWVGDVEWSSHIFSALGNDNGKHIGWGLIAGRARPGSKGDPSNPLVFHFNVYGLPESCFTLPRGESIENRWLHVAVVFDRANTAHLYLDGKHRGSVAKGKPVYLGPLWLQIGCAEIVDADFYRGRLAHVAVYPRALSEQQIQNHYNQRNTGKEVAGQ